jgi:hypothetical protein
MSGTIRWCPATAITVPGERTAYFFAFSPSSTRRRMASERDAAFVVAHASTSATRAGGKRALTRGSFLSPGVRAAFLGAP